jgi:transposase
MHNGENQPGDGTQSGTGNQPGAPAAVAGADVSRDWIDVACQKVACQKQGRQGHDSIAERRFDNTPAGHDRLIEWLRKGGLPARITIEASGIYSLDLALALWEAEGIELMVAHPKALKNYRSARGRRAKTDRVDARLICDFCRRMPFQAWTPPSEEAFELRALARRLQTLVEERIREKARLHAATTSRHASSYVANDIEVNIRHLERRIERIEAEALALIGRHEALAQACEHLRSVKGIGDRSAVKLLGELAMMPKNLTVRQWVAFAGLDVRHHESGTSVSKPGRISKQGNARLRKALYMPAQVAIQNEPNVRAFYDKLLKRGKKPMVAIVAVMRKLLHSIYGMLKHKQDFDGQKFYRIPASAA